MLALCVLLVLSTAAFGAVKNVIVLIPDGCDQAVQTATRLYKNHALGIDGPLAVDTMDVCMARTYMANSVVTGSAAAATAFSSGYKTTVRFLGVGPDPVATPNLTGFESPIAPYAPVETILEAAKAAGKATGLVATSRITHATPAAYACHIQDRGMDNEIMEHMVYLDLDVAFGGGKRHLLTTDQGGKRTDGEDLLRVLTDRGYQWVETRDELMALTSGKAWGLFASSHMDSDIDRDDANPTEPSIAEMTSKAIELLSQDPDGFFIMIEGSQVDWAGHANDPVWMITDFLAFDAAVQVALDFAQANGDTMVIAFPDHDTGSMSIGHEQGFNEYAGPHYTDTSIEFLIDPIKDASMTVEQLIDMFPTDAPSPAAIRDAFVANWGPWWNVMTDEQAQAILDMGGDSYAISQYVSAEFTGFGWTTHGHSGEDVPVWTYVNGDAQGPKGVIENTDLAVVCADAMGVTLNGTGAWVEYDESVLDMTDEANPVAVIDGVQYPVSKDIRVLADGTVENMIGVTVYAPLSGKVYIPVQ
jgi:alkaline phosphatase